MVAFRKTMAGRHRASGARHQTRADSFFFFSLTGPIQYLCRLLLIDLFSRLLSLAEGQKKSICSIGSTSSISWLSIYLYNNWTCTRHTLALSLSSARSCPSPLFSLALVSNTHVPPLLTGKPLDDDSFLTRTRARTLRLPITFRPLLPPARPVYPSSPRGSHRIALLSTLLSPTRPFFFFFIISSDALSSFPIQLSATRCLPRRGL